MGNLFRCPTNSDKKEYIIKKVGIVQEGYEAISAVSAYGDSSGGDYWVQLNKSGKVVMYILFDTTKWNKLHIKNATSSDNGIFGRRVIGVSKTINLESSPENFMAVMVELPIDVYGDYVLDISALSGKYYFLLYVSNGGESASTYTTIYVMGDVYLSK